MNKLNNLTIQEFSDSYIELSREYIDAMIEATPCEYYARICAFIGC
jgi:hypothetical protein